MNNRSSNAALHNAIEFKAINGDALSTNPREDLYKNRKVFHADISYQAIQPLPNIGITELWGERPEQEDRVSTGMIEGTNWDCLSNNEYKEILKRTTDRLQNYLSHYWFGFSEGSTLCATLILGNTVYTVNVGDSEAFYCLINETGNVLELESLNAILHNPNEPTEAKRLTKGGYDYCQDDYGGAINGDDGGLRVSRSMGDGQFEKHGLVHLPDTYDDTIIVPSNGKGFIFVACDGLRENKAFTLKEIATVLETNQHQAMNQLSTKLAMSALKSGSGDNISVCITPLNQETSYAKYMAIFDGHCGQLASEALSHLFAPSLELNIRCAMLTHLLNDSITDEKMKDQLNSILHKIKHICDDAIYHYTYTHFNDVQSELEYSSDCNLENILRLKLIIEKCAWFLAELLHALNNNQIMNADLEQQIKGTHAFLDLVLSTTLLEDMKDRYCPDTDNVFVTYPLSMTSDLIHKIAQANKNNALYLHEQFKNSLYEFEPIYRIAGIIFSIGQGYNHAMQLSYDLDSYKRSDAIGKMEKAVLQDFASSAQPRSVIVEHLLRTVTKIGSNIPDVSSFKQVFSFFKYNDNLKMRIDNAIYQITNIGKEIEIEAKDNLSYKEMPSIRY
jgi:serine/threonine protein phosphatase PrpC